MVDMLDFVPILLLLAAGVAVADQIILAVLKVLWRILRAMFPSLSAE